MLASGLHSSKRASNLVAGRERKPINWLACNPFSFIKLFTYSRTMTTLVLAIGFQSIGEPRFAIDICSTIWRAVHNVPTQRMGNLPAVFGICERSSGRLGLLPRL